MSQPRGSGWEGAFRGHTGKKAAGAGGTALHPCPRRPALPGAWAGAGPALLGPPEGLPLRLPRSFVPGQMEPARSMGPWLLSPDCAVWVGDRPESGCPHLCGRHCDLTAKGSGGCCSPRPAQGHLHGAAPGLPALALSAPLSGLVPSTSPPSPGLSAAWSLGSRQPCWAGSAVCPPPAPAPLLSSS